MGRSSVLIAAAAIALLFQFTGEANARGGGLGPSCQRDSAGGNMGTITGTATVDVINYNGGFADAVDATLWLTWKGKQGVFRWSLSTGTTGGVEIVSAADLLCKVLANDPYNADSTQLLSQFVGANATSLYITNKSIILGGNLNLVPNSGNYPVPCSLCNGGSTTYDASQNFSTIAAVTIYVPGK